jgi:serine protease Do
MHSFIKMSLVYLLWSCLYVTSVQAANLPDFQTIVEKNTPAVVKILVEYSVDSNSGDGAAPNAQEMPEALRRFFEYRGAPPQQQQRPRQSMGSGFIISADGYIVTNNHVVQDAEKVTVRLTDRREYEARVVGLDERSDLALLQVEADDLPVLKLGRPGELAVGEWVLAIGSPFGLDYSVTAGIVSAKGRSLPTESRDNYVPFIQTDVAINPGNSGGPLFNLDGDVVGVNSQIFTRSGGSIGLSFAIPVSVVINVVEQLKASGKVTRGWLGVTIQDVNKNLAESFGLDRPQGALISQLQEGGPADRGGLLPGDVILRFDGSDIATSADLPHVVGLIRPGTEVKVNIIRERKRKVLSMEVGGLGADEEPSVAANQDPITVGGRIGVVVEDIDDQLQSRWGISGGVLVSQVAPDSPAAEAGIRKGDVITLIDGAPITSLDSYENALEQLESGRSVAVRLVRRGAPLFIGLKPE